MLDIIIPIYEKKSELLKTIASIEPLNKNYHITIVNDCSPTETYEDIVEQFKGIYDITLINLPKNVGPGQARQAALEQTKSPYIMFLDAGDVLLSIYSIPRLLEPMLNDPYLGMVSSPHLSEVFDAPAEVVPAINNRIHGKMYSRKFIETYNISWTNKQPYANEDIGWNQTFRLIASDIAQHFNINSIYHIDEPAVLWTIDTESLTRKEKGAFYYREQNLGLALNNIYAVSILKANGVSENIIKENVYDILVTLYFFYMGTVESRPEFTDIAYSGLYTYFCEFYEDYFKEVDMKMLNFFYTRVLFGFLQDENDPIRNQTINFNFLKCMEEMKEQYEKEQLQ